jgi:hypothetical protein
MTNIPTRKHFTFQADSAQALLEGNNTVTSEIPNVDAGPIPAGLMLRRDFPPGLSCTGILWQNAMASLNQCENAMPGTD